MQLISQGTTTAEMTASQSSSLQNHTNEAKLQFTQMPQNIAEIIGLEMLGSNPNDLPNFLAKLSTNYGINFLDQETIDYRRAEEIFSRCVELRWSKYEFDKRLNEFLDTNKWFNFTRADFLNMERSKLYPHSWYLEQVAKNPSAKFEAYYVGTDIMYRFKSDRPIRGLKQIEWFKSGQAVSESHRLEQSEADAKETWQKVSELCKKYNFKNPFEN